MKYKCLSKDPDVTWLTVGEEYEAETHISNDPFYGGGKWLEIRVADDGYPCFARKLHFVAILNNK